MGGPWVLGCTRIQVLGKYYFGPRRLTLRVPWDQVKALGFSHPLGKGHLLERGPIPFDLTTYLPVAQLSPAPSLLLLLRAQTGGLNPEDSLQEP